MAFKKILLSKNELKINGEVSQLQSVKIYFQDHLNKVIALGITPSKDDLNLLFVNPKEYIADRLTRGEQMKVGGLNLNKERLFDLIDKPNGTNDLIDSIQKDITHRKTREFYIWKVKNFSVDKNRVIINPEYLESITQRHSLFIETETQKKGFEKVQQIVKLINEINQIGSAKLRLDTNLSKLLKGNVSEYEVNPSSLSLFK